MRTDCQTVRGIDANKVDEKTLTVYINVLFLDIISRMRESKKKENFRR